MKIKLLPFNEAKTNFNNSCACDFDTIYGITEELWEKVRVIGELNVLKEYDDDYALQVGKGFGFFPKCCCEVIEE